MTQEGPGGSVADLLAWLERRNREVVVRINSIPFNPMKASTPKASDECWLTSGAAWCAILALTLFAVFLFY